MPEPEPPETARGVTYLGHATVVVWSGSGVYITDPVFSDRIGRVFTKRLAHLSFDPKTLEGLQAILISHPHHDHLEYRSLGKLGKQVPILVPWGLSLSLTARGFRDVRTLRPWETVAFGDDAVMAVPARHFGGRVIPVGSGYQGYVLAMGKTIYFAGDTGFDADMFRAIGRRVAIDLAVLPIAGYVFPWFRRNHMNAEEALEAFRLLGARRMVPMHFETFPASFEPQGEPRRRLMACAERLGLSDSVVILDSGDHHPMA